MVKVKEQALVEKLVAHATVEALTEAVLHRLSWRNEMPHDPVVLRPPAAEDYVPVIVKSGGGSFSGRHGCPGVA